jgi:hypothetical protein
MTNRWDRWECWREKRPRKKCRVLQVERMRLRRS